MHTEKHIIFKKGQFTKTVSEPAEVSVICQIYCNWNRWKTACGSFIRNQKEIFKKNVYCLMEKRSELYPPFLMPRSTIAQVHQVLHLLHCFDCGHLETPTHSYRQLIAMNIDCLFSSSILYIFHNVTYSAQLIKITCKSLNVSNSFVLILTLTNNKQSVLKHFIA